MGLINEVEDAPHDEVDATPLNSGERGMIVALNRNLIEYFARLANSKNSNEAINLEYVQSLLDKKARINCTDKFGQTVLHEVCVKYLILNKGHSFYLIFGNFYFSFGFPLLQAARAWHVDVAKFLIEEAKANINQADKLGRTPLHVAAAVDYPEMVNFLIKSGGKAHLFSAAKN